MKKFSDYLWDYIKDKPELWIYAIFGALSILAKLLWPRIKKAYDRYVVDKKNKKLILNIGRESTTKALLVELRVTSKADRALIMQIHNGIEFVNSNFHKLYVSCTFEAVRSGLVEEGKNMQRIPLSSFNNVIMSLLERDVLYFKDLSLSRIQNAGIRNIITPFTTKGIVLMKVSNAHGKITGFVALYYSDLAKLEEAENEIDKNFNIVFELSKQF